MRDRLIELYHNIEIEYLDYLTNIAKRAINDDIEDKIQKRQDFYVDKLLANGVIVPPCKVGDTVFYINEVCDENANEYLDISVGEVISFSIQKEGFWMYCRYEDGLTYWHLVADDFGKTVFLTKEEAEQALKGGEG